MNEAMLEDDELELHEDDESDDETMAEDDEFLPLPFLPNPFQSRRPGVRTAPNRSYGAPGLTAWVSRPEFNQALSKVRADVARNSTAIKRVDTRVAAEAAVNAKQNQAIVKQNKTLVAQAKAITSVKRQVKKAKEASILMAMLARPKTLPATTQEQQLSIGTQSVTVPAGSKIAYESDKGNSMLLPLLLMGGLGGDGDSGGDSSMLLMMLAMGGGL
jgi:hypothetical protein